MKNQIIAMMSSMNEEELTKIYQFVVEMMQTKQGVRYFDETTNYIKYRSLCSVPQNFLGVGIQSPSLQEYIEEKYNETKEGSWALLATEKCEVPMEYNELMEDEISIGTNDADKMTVFGSDNLRKDILSITILNSVKEIPVNHWDVSKKQNKSILAWVVEKRSGKELFLYSARKIMASSCKGLFAKYYNLNEIRFNHWFYTNNASDMSDMFMDCEKLKSLDLSTFGTSKVTNMKRLFLGCSQLRDLNLCSFDTSKVTDMSGMFGICSELRDLNLSTFNTSKVTDMSCMFGYCSELRDLNLSTFNTSKVTDMNCMFGYCSELRDLDLSTFNTSKVTDMKYMFFGCSQLINLNLSAFDTSKVIDMEWMFAGCDKLSEETKNRFQ